MKLAGQELDGRAVRLDLSQSRRGGGGDRGRGGRGGSRGDSRGGSRGGPRGRGFGDRGGRGGRGGFGGAPRGRGRIEFTGTRVEL